MRKKAHACVFRVSIMAATAAAAAQAPQYPDYPSETPHEFKPPTTGMDHILREFMIPPAEHVLYLRADHDALER
jgi:hypothetical protein